MTSENNETVKNTNDDFEELVNNNKEAMTKFTVDLINGSFEAFRIWTQPWMKQMMVDYFKNIKKDF